MHNITLWQNSSTDIGFFGPSVCVRHRSLCSVSKQMLPIRPRPPPRRPRLPQQRSLGLQRHRQYSKCRWPHSQS